MKKILTLLSAFLFIFLFSACSQSGKQSSQAEQISSTKSAVDDFFTALKAADINKLVEMTAYDPDMIPYTVLVQGLQQAVVSARDNNGGLASWQIGEVIYQNDIKAKVYLTEFCGDGTLELDSILMIKVNDQWRFDIESTVLNALRNEPQKPVGEMVG